jgi:hypothetical protein
LKIHVTPSGQSRRPLCKPHLSIEVGRKASWGTIAEPTDFDLASQLVRKAEIRPFVVLRPGRQRAPHNDNGTRRRVAPDAADGHG